MMYPKPLFWHSGQFLEPQHFQETDRWNLHGRGEILRLVRPCFEGVVRVAVNPAALAENTLSFDEAELFFPDGAHAVWNGRREDGNASPLRRALPEMEDGELTVHARLDRFRARHNAAGLDKADTPHPERYDACPDEMETPDRHAQKHPALSGDERILTRLNHNIQILWGSELGDGAGGMTLPLTRLIRRDGAFAVDPSFVPPLATVHGSESLALRLRRFMTLLADFPGRMEDAGAAGSGAPPLAELLTRQSAARLLSELDTLLSWTHASPWETYRVLRAACAEMAAAAPGESVPLPRYDHAAPGACFPEILACAEHLLSRFLPEEIAAVAPEYAEGLLLFPLPEAAFAPGVSFRLSVRTDEPPEALLREGRLIAGSPDAVRDAVKLALPTVPLAPVPAPRGLASGGGARYFAPGDTHPSWKAALAARRLAVAYYPRHNPGAERLTAALRLHILRGGSL